MEPPAAKDSNTLVAWSADVRQRLEVHKGASGDPDDVEAEQAQAEPDDEPTRRTYIVGWSEGWDAAAAAHAASTEQKKETS